MQKIIFTLILLSLTIFCFAQGNYYDSVINLTGQSLYTALHSLISTNTNNSYNGSKAFLFQQLDNVDGYVTCIYTGQSFYVGYNYTGSTNPNTEHTYAQSWFAVEDDPVRRSDLHHLFPTDSNVNSARSNYPLFTVANHNSASVYYSYTPWQSYRGLSANGYTVFEPADESKGNIARALLYFNTRYYDTLTQQNVNMIPDLVIWNEQDPPDAIEIARNNAIYEFQNNRNPYVDHPEFVNRIWTTPISDDAITSPPSCLSLSSITPNPFHTLTVINIKSQEVRKAEISIYNLKGQKIRTWNQTLLSGSTELVWNATNTSGTKVPPGIYLINIKSGGETIAAKVLLN